MFDRTVDSFPFNIGTLINIETKIQYGQETNQKKTTNTPGSFGTDDQKIALLDKVFANFLKAQTNRSSAHLKSSVYIDKKDLKKITQFSTFKVSKGNLESSNANPSMASRVMNLIN